MNGWFMVLFLCTERRPLGDIAVLVHKVHQNDSVSKAVPANFVGFFVKKLFLRNAVQKGIPMVLKYFTGRPFSA
jgi:hypothetical protein